MSLKEVELRPGWFIYRCESCGFEHPKMGVKKHYLGAPPARSCSDLQQMTFAEIVKEQ